MTPEAPVKIEYEPQPQGAGLFILDGPDALRVVIPASSMQGVWKTIALACLPLIAALISFARRRSDPLLAPNWTADLLRFAGCAAAVIAAAWFIHWYFAGRSAEVVVTSEQLQFQSGGRFARRSGQWPTEQIAHAELSLTGGVCVRHVSGKTLFRLSRASTVDSRVVIIAINKRLGRRWPKAP